MLLRESLLLFSWGMTVGGGKGAKSRPQEGDHRGQYEERGTGGVSRYMQRYNASFSKPGITVFAYF